MIKRTIYIGNPGYVSTSQNQLIIKDDGGNVLSNQLPIEDIGILLLDHPQITITHGAIQRLLANNAVLISCDEKHMPASLMLSMDKHHLLTRRHLTQISVSDPLRKQLWKQTVMAKIKNQSHLLLQRNIPDKSLAYISKTVKSGDSENNEAHASRVYWDKIMNGIKRERHGDEPNNLLNYGYAILRAITARSLVSTGLIPSLGIHHKNQYNSYCLADDIMEPYRPFVDQLVFELYEETETVHVINKALKTRLLSIPTLDVRIKKKRSPLSIAMSTTTSSLYDCFDGKRRTIIYPEFA